MKTVGCNDKSKQTAFKQKAQFKEFFSENVFIKELPLDNLYISICDIIVQVNSNKLHSTRFF